MHVVYTILAVAIEAIIDGSLCLLDNQSTCNAFIDGKYISKFRDSPGGKYPCVHCNSGVTYTNQIGDLPGYSNTFWYNSKVISIIVSLRLGQKTI